MLTHYMSTYGVSSVFIRACKNIPRLEDVINSPRCLEHLIHFRVERVGFVSQRQSYFAKKPRNKDIFEATSERWRKLMITLSAGEEHQCRSAKIARRLT